MTTSSISTAAPRSAPGSSSRAEKALRPSPLGGGRLSFGQMRAYVHLHERAFARALRLADRSVWPSDRLCARIGDRPMRLSLRLLHVGGHELPAQAGCPVAR